MAYPDGGHHTEEQSKLEKIETLTEYERFYDSDNIRKELKEILGEKE